MPEVDDSRFESGMHQEKNEIEQQNTILRNFLDGYRKKAKLLPRKRKRLKMENGKVENTR